MDPVSTSNSMKTSKTNPSVHVIFRKIEECYPVHSDIFINYSISGAHEITKNDWIGLYRVGWRSHKEYIYYDWSPYPSNYVKDMSVENSVIFPGNKMPGEDEEFYQFCYVTSSGQVKGASTPFQFKSAFTDDLIEVEDENDDVMIVKTRTSVLEERLEKANNDQLLTKQKLHLLEKELDHMYLLDRDAQKKLQEFEKAEKELTSALEERNEGLAEQKQQNAHLTDCIGALKEKLEVLKQEKLSIEKRLDESDTYIASLQDKIKNLVIEKDCLNGKIKNLEEDNAVLKEFLKDFDHVRSTLVEEETNNLKLKGDLEVAGTEILKLKQLLEQQAIVNKEEKLTQALLADRLQNMENKLDAADNCKKMLNEEVLLLRQMQEKAVEAYDVVKAENEGIKIKLNELGKDKEKWSEDLEIVMKEKESLKKHVADQNEEIDRLTQQVSSMKDGIDQQAKAENCGANDDIALFALNLAHKSLKERYSELSKKFEECKQTMNVLKIENEALKTSQSFNDKEISSLRERLMLCRDTYKEKYVECELLEKKLSSLNGPLKQHRYLSEELVNKPYFEEFENLDESVNDMKCELLASKLKKYKGLFWNEHKKFKMLQVLLKEKEEECAKLKDNAEQVAVKVQGDMQLVEKSQHNSNQSYSFKANNCDMTIIDMDVIPNSAGCVMDKVATDAASVVDEEATSVGSVEDEVVTLRCPICDKLFDSSNKDYLVDHVDTHLSGGYDCPLCQEHFDEHIGRDRYMEHVKAHFE
ncbi:hypothetical protein HELRODRAFT_190319 [Helobdella robusta]|uniref:SKICH domain-containing protein n=1 Tax=Helobdella robusta TaxID=6412 RepID=T1FRW6_HELRO|nr:hypothetical protein HELRODRAFT_190319 [Helobdella robusta]ESO09892.1 hypothetical protein HELRODRAFT_190319 [Helobdella robusta]